MGEAITIHSREIHTICHQKGISEGISQPPNDTEPHVRLSRNFLSSCLLEKIGVTRHQLNFLSPG